MNGYILFTLNYLDGCRLSVAVATITLTHVEINSKHVDGVPAMRQALCKVFGPCLSLALL